MLHLLLTTDLDVQHPVAGDDALHLGDAHEDEQAAHQQAAEQQHRGLAGAHLLLAVAAVQQQPCDAWTACS